MHNSAGETTGIRHCDVFLLPIFVYSNKGWPVVVRGTARAPAQNRPELCVGQAESKPGQGERRASPLCGHENRPARGGCAGRGALAPNPAETTPSARTLPLLYNKRAAGASKRRNSQARPTVPEPPGKTFSAGTARQNLQRRNRQAEPSAPEPPGRTFSAGTARQNRTAEPAAPGARKKSACPP